MTTYKGETVLLSHTAVFDGETLDDTNTNSVNIDIYDSAYTALIHSDPMVWSATHSRWEIFLPTASFTAGKYNAKVTITSDEATNWEYFKFTIKADPSADVIV